MENAPSVWGMIVHMSSTIDCYNATLSESLLAVWPSEFAGGCNEKLGGLCLAIATPFSLLAVQFI